MIHLPANLYFLHLNELMMKLVVRITLIGYTVIIVLNSLMPKVST